MTLKNNTKKRLVVFDVEGVIIPKRLYLLLHASKRLGFIKILKITFLGLLYEIGFLTLERALQGIYRLFRGVPEEEFYKTLKTVPIIPGVQQVLEKLREDKYKIALISSGIPDFLVRELARQLGADYARGVDVEVVDGKVTGRISGEVVEEKGKAKVLEKILQEKNHSRSHCIVVADDRNNIPMSALASRTIGYNPDLLMAARCDYVVKGRLQDIIPLLETPVKTVRIPYTKNEAFRDIIHVGSFLIPILCQFYNFDRYTVAAVIMATSIAYALSEMARGAGINLPPLTTITNMATVGEEEWSFATSPIFFALGISLSLVLYPPEAGFTAITVLTVGDGIARLAGKKLGSRVLPYNKAKSLEGAVVGALLSTIASLIFVPPFKAIVSSAIGMAVETLPLPINDNILIPLVVGVALIAIK